MKKVVVTQEMAPIIIKTSFSIYGWAIHVDSQEHSGEMKMETYFSIYGWAINAPLLDNHSGCLIIQIYGWAIHAHMVSFCYC